MLSRVADAFYWMGRYLERAEHTARLVDVNTYLSLDSTPESSGRHWHRVFDSLQVTIADDGPPDVGALVQQLALERGNKESIASSIHAARENLRQIREQISAELWERINRLYWLVRRTADDAGLAGPAAPVPARRHRGLPPVHRPHDRDDEPRRGLLLPRARPLPRAGHHLLGAARRARPGLPRPAPRAKSRPRSSPSGRRCCARARRSRPTRAASPRASTPGGSPTSCCSTPSSRARSASRSSRSRAALRGITRLSGRENAGRPERLAGRLRASLHYAQLDEIVDDSLQAFLNGISRQCGDIHAATYRTFIGYHLDAALV